MYGCSIDNDMKMNGRGGNSEGVTMNNLVTGANGLVKGSVTSTVSSKVWVFSEFLCLCGYIDITV